MKKVTIKDVANASGVSTATVSRVLNKTGYVSKEVIEKVHRTMEELKYKPNAVARSLKQAKTNTIGVVIPDITNPHFMMIAKAVEEAILGQDYNLIFCSSEESSEKERELLQLLYEKRVDAIILATAGDNEQIVQSIYQSGTPVILIDRTLDIKHATLDYVVENNVNGAYKLTEKVIKNGHKRMGIINGTLKVSTGIERFEGFKMAMADYQLPIDEELIFYGDFTEKTGIEGARHFLGLENPPTAIISFNNKMTFGVLQELVCRGEEGRICIGTYGDVEAARLLKGVEMVILKQDPFEIGRRVGKILLDRLSGNNEVVHQILDSLIVETH